MLCRNSSNSWAPEIASSAIAWFTWLWVAPLQCASPTTWIDKKWTTADGLPSSSISGIARGSDGLIWIATTEGLVRFDGARFDPFTQPLPKKDITYLTSGPDGRIYVGIFGAGFATIQRNRVRTFTRSEVQTGLQVSMILPVGGDEAWVATLNGRLYHFQADALTEVGSGVLTSTAIYGLAKSPDGVLWIGTSSGLFRLQNGQVKPYRPRKPFPSASISDLAVTTNGTVFAATEHGLLRIEGDQWRLWTTKDGLPDNFLKVLAPAGEDLWIGTRTGLAKLSGNRIQRLGKATCPVYALLPEVDGGVWFGCDDIGGLYRISYPLLQTLQMPKALADTSINSIAEDSTGAVWLASNQGVGKWDRNRTALYTPNGDRGSNYVFGITFAPDHSVWLATESGFAHLDRGRMQSFHSLPKGSADPIYAVLQDRSGTVWVGTNRGLLQRSSGEAELKPVPRITSLVWSLYEDSKGNVWAGTDGSGLFRLSSGSVEQYNRDSGLTTNRAIDTWEGPSGDIWVATDRGIVRIRNSRSAHIGSANGLPSGPVLTLVDDGQGRFWIRFQKGLFVVKSAEVNRVLDQGSGMVYGRFLGAEDGLGEQLHRNLGQGSIIRHSSGEIWCALNNGIAKFNPLALSLEPPPSTPEVLHVATDAGERDLTQHIVTKAADRNVRFVFTAPTLTGAKSLEYRYRLIGFDQHWRNIEAETPVMYTALPPGYYQFEVSARRSYGLWSNVSAPVDLQVLPHFYQTWWWYSLTVLASFSAILLLFQLRLIAARNQFAALLAERLSERSRVARELHDTLSRSLGTILTQLEAAQVLLNRDSRILGEHLEKVSQLASEATKESRMSIFALRSPEMSGSSLVDTLQQYATAFSLDTSIQVVWSGGGLFLS